MKKKDWNFDLWCRKATEKIHYRPDRKRVCAELRAHLEDAYDTHIARGLPPDEAEQKALEAMGSASQVAAQLAAVHSPFWAYVLQVSQIALVVLLVLSLIPIWKYADSLDLQDAPKLYDFDIYNSASYGGDTGRTLLHLSQPDISFTSDGSRFTATDAAMFTEYSEYHERDVTRLYILVRQTSLLPWKEHREYTLYHTAVSQFFVRDDKGNRYPFHADGYLYSKSVQSGIFASTHEYWVNDFPADAKWAEICYERDGRSFALRIDLTGGDQA